MGECADPDIVRGYLTLPGIIYLEDSAVEVEGLRIYGCVVLPKQTTILLLLHVGGSGS